MDAPKTLLDAVKFFDSFENCKDFMVALRWPNGVTCPTCGSSKVTWLESVKRWKCYSKHDRPQFSLKTGTIFEDSPLGLDKWLPCVWLIVNCKNGVSSYEIHRDLKVTQKTAWFMLHRVRLAMQEDGAFGKFSGTIEADETLVGGKAANMHLDKRTRVAMGGSLRGGQVGKAVVAGLLDRENGRARVKVMPRDAPGSLKRTVARPQAIRETKA